MNFQRAFNDLLSAWRFHEELREHGAGFDEIVDSQIRLQAARDTMMLVRKGI